MRPPARVLLAATAVAVAAAVVPAAFAAPAPAERPAAGSYDPSTLLVAFAPGASAVDRSAAHGALGAAVQNTIGALDLDVVRLPSGLDAADAAARYERIAAVDYTDLNWRFEIAATSNDTLFKDEWGLHNTGQAVTGSFVRSVADVDIDAPEGWDIAFGAGQFESAGGTRVGVLDTGIDRSHVDLLDKTKACATATSATGVVVNGTCSDDNLHGTHVAGTIAAATNNGVGVAGVAPNAELAVFKALNSAGVGFYADIVAGVQWLSTTGGAKVINMSIGGPQDDALDKALTDAAARGVLLIGAAGNDGDDTPNYPAFHKDVVSVASVDAAGKRSSFSNCNSDVEIAAPGTDVWSTFPGNTYGVISGTSMATPHVAGVAAMVMSEKGLSASQTRSTLTSTDQGNGGCNNVGIVNLAAALGGSSTGGTTEPTGTGSIAGAVTEQRTKKAIAGATVDCGVGGTGTTGSDGRYTITDVAVGSYSCTASASGYRSKTANVSVSDGVTTTASFALR
ncbi:MAG: S8 family serine peptidase [Actinomycetes bacterium]